VAFPEACCLPQEARPTLPLAESSSLLSAALQHFKARQPFFSPGSRPAFEKHHHAFQKSRPQGLATLSTALAIPPTEVLSQPPTLLGFTLQSFFPTLWPTSDFSKVFRSYVFLPNPLAWQRRFSGSRSQDQLCFQLPTPFMAPGGATALLGFCTFRAFLRRILRKAPSFSLPLSFFPCQPPKMPTAGTSGDSFRRLSDSLLSKGAHPRGVHDRPPSAAP
jgi:hypothetical protein